MIDVLQAHRPGNTILSLDGGITRQKSPAIIAPLYEGMDGVSVSGDRGDARFAILIAKRLRFADAVRAPAGGGSPGRLGVVHPQGNVMHAVAVQPDQFGGDVVGPERCGEDKTDAILHQDVRGPRAIACLGSAVGRQFHAERGAVIISRLAGVAHVKFQIIGPVQRQEIRLSGLGRGRDVPVI